MKRGQTSIDGHSSPAGALPDCCGSVEGILFQKGTVVDIDRLQWRRCGDLTTVAVIRNILRSERTSRSVIIGKSDYILRRRIQNCIAIIRHWDTKIIFDTARALCLICIRRRQIFHIMAVAMRLGQRIGHNFNRCANPDTRSKHHCRSKDIRACQSEYFVTPYNHMRSKANSVFLSSIFFQNPQPRRAGSRVAFDLLFRWNNRFWGQNPEDRICGMIRFLSCFLFHVATRARGGRLFSDAQKGALDDPVF